jgi:hypothetical protein
LDKGIPLYYAGWSVPNIEGHAFICDAYQKDSTEHYYYHFNFGWNGSSDAYFYTGALSPAGNDFNLAQELIVNAFPDTATFPYPATPLTGTSILTKDAGSFSDGFHDCPPNMDYSWIIRPDVDDITLLQFEGNYVLTENDTLFISSLNGNVNTFFTNDTATFSINEKDSEITARLKTTNTTTSSGGITGSYTTRRQTYCGGAVTTYSATTGSFGDGSKESRYNNNTSCRMSISVNGVRSITLRFTVFETEKDKDFLYIHDNASGSGTPPLLLSLSGSYTDSSYTFQTNKLFFIFETDEINIDQGWELTYATDVLEIPEIEDNKMINIFPNPSEGKIQIISEQQDVIAVEVINITGQLIYCEKVDFKRNTEIVLSMFPSGLYFVRVTDATNAVTIRKIIRS